MIYTALSLATTGLNQPASLTDPAYPQMVAVSALQWDGNGVCGSYFGYVRPENAVISAAAEKAHGITNRMAQSRGLPERFALSWITNTLRASSHVIGWQLASDLDVIRSALIRHGQNPADLIRPGLLKIDLSALCAPVIGEVGEDGDYLPMTMAEAYERLKLGVWCGDMQSRAYAIQHIFECLTARQIIPQEEIAA